MPVHDLTMASVSPPYGSSTHASQGFAFFRSQAHSSIQNTYEESLRQLNPIISAAMAEFLGALLVPIVVLPVVTELLGGIAGVR